MPDERLPGRDLTGGSPPAQGAAGGAARVIGEALDDLARAKARRSAADAVEAAKRPMKPRLTFAALMVALVALAVLFVTNIQGISLLSLVRPSPSPAIARRQADDALRMIVDDIELFRKDFSELPGSLAEIGTPIAADWSYTKSGGHYQVSLKHHGQFAAFDSRTKGGANAPP